MEDFLKEISTIEKFVKDRKLKKLKMTGVTTNAHDEINFNFDRLLQFYSSLLGLFGSTDDQLNKIQNLINTKINAIETQMNIFYEKFEEMLNIDVSKFESLASDENIFNVSAETNVVENFVKGKLQDNDITIIKNGYGILESNDDIKSFYLSLLNENQLTQPEETELNGHITTDILPQIETIKTNIGYTSVGDVKPTETGVGKYYIRNYTAIGGEQSITENETQMIFNLQHYTYVDNNCSCVLSRVDGETITIGETTYSTEYLKYNSAHEKYNIDKDSDGYVIQNGNRVKKYSNSSVEIEHYFYKISDANYGIILPYSNTEWKLEKPVFEVEKISNKSLIEFEYRLTHIIIPLCYYSIGSEKKLFSYRFSLENSVSTSNGKMLIDTTDNEFTIKGIYHYKN